MMEHRQKIFKLLIMPTQNALQLLQWIRKNIPDIAACGVGIRIQKINKDEFDAEMVDSMRNKGITNLPALISPAGKIYIGNPAIISMFSGGLTRARASTRTSELIDTTDIDVNDYLSREITEGMRRTPKGLVAPENEDKDEDDDIQHKLNDYQRRAPKQHRAHGTAEHENVAPRRPNRRSGGRRPAPGDEYDDYTNNYGQNDDRRNGRPPVRGHSNYDEDDDDYDMDGGVGADAIDSEYDRMMLDTMLSNVPTPGM